MHKIFFVLSYFLIVVLKTYCQDSISFRMHYLPEHEYANTSIQKFNVEMSFAGSDSMLSYLAQKGFKNPTITGTETKLKNVCTTGKMNSDSIMPIETIFLEDEDGQGKPLLPKGTKLVGTVSYNKMPVYTSMVSDELSEEQKEKYVKNPLKLLTKIPLPQTKMIIGDEYVQNTPVSIPMGPINLDMTIATTYKLVSTSDTLANFAIGIKFRMKSKVKDTIPITGDGEGKGTMIYDRRNEYPLFYNIHYSVTANSKVNSANLHITLSGEGKHEYAISKK